MESARTELVSTSARKRPGQAARRTRLTQVLPIVLGLISLALPACQKQEDQSELEHQQIVVTSPKAKDVIITQQYVCQIHSRRHIKVRALQNGYLQELRVNEGQAVKKGDLMFQILPT